MDVAHLVSPRHRTDALARERRYRRERQELLDHIELLKAELNTATTRPAPDTANTTHTKDESELKKAQEGHERVLNEVREKLELEQQRCVELEKGHNVIKEDHERLKETHESLTQTFHSLSLSHTMYETKVDELTQQLQHEQKLHQSLADKFKSLYKQQQQQQQQQVPLQDQDLTKDDLTSSSEASQVSQAHEEALIELRGELKSQSQAFEARLQQEQERYLALERTHLETKQEVSKMSELLSVAQRETEEESSSSSSSSSSFPSSPRVSVCIENNPFNNPFNHPLNHFFIYLFCNHTIYVITLVYNICMYVYM